MGRPRTVRPQLRRDSLCGQRTPSRSHATSTNRASQSATSVARGMLLSDVASNRSCNRPQCGVYCPGSCLVHSW